VGFRSAQFVAHLENLPSQVVGLLACTATVALAGARGSNARGQVSPRCAHYAADGRYFWPRQAAAVFQVNCLQRPQGIWHTTLGWGVVCAGEGQITLAPVGAGHAVYIGDPHIDTHIAGPGMQTLRGVAICGLARVFGWHHLVLPRKPFGPRIEPVKGYCYCLITYDMYTCCMLNDLFQSCYTIIEIK